MDGYEKLPNKEEVDQFPEETIAEHDELLDFAPKAESLRGVSSRAYSRYRYVRIITFGVLLAVSLLLVAASVYFIVTNERISKDFVQLCREGWCLKTNMDEFLVPDNNSTFGFNIPLLRMFKVQTLILTSNAIPPEKVLTDKRLLELKKNRKQLAVSLYLVVEGPYVDYYSASTQEHFSDFDGYIARKNFLDKTGSDDQFFGKVFLNNKDIKNVEVSRVAGRYVAADTKLVSSFISDICDQSELPTIAELTESASEASLSKVVAYAMIVGFSKNSVVAQYDRNIELDVERNLEVLDSTNYTIVYVKALRSIAVIRSMEFAVNFSACSLESSLINDLHVLKKSSPSMVSYLIYSSASVGNVDLKNTLNYGNKFVSYKMIHGIKEETLDKKAGTLDMAENSALWIHVEL